MRSGDSSREAVLMDTGIVDTGSTRLGLGACGFCETMCLHACIVSLLSRPQAAGLSADASHTYEHVC